MRILHVLHHFRPCQGGMEQVALSLAREQAKRGHEVRVVCLDVCSGKKGKLPGQESWEGIEIFRIPSLDLHYYKPALFPLSRLKWAEVVHVHALGFFSDFLAFTSFFHGKPLFLSTHGGIFHTPSLSLAKRLYFFSLQPLLARAYSKIFAVSDADLRLFSRIAPAEKLALMENGIDVQRFSPGKKEPGLFISVGRIAPNKRFPLLLESFSLLREQEEGFRLEIIGGGKEEDLAALRKKSESLGVGNHAAILGEVDEAQLSVHLARASFFVSASSYEGFGLAALEGMASGCVPLLQRLPSFEKFCAGSGAGKTLDFSEKKQAAQELLLFLRLPAKELASQGKKAREYAGQFGWEKKAAEMEKAYQAALLAKLEKAKTAPVKPVKGPSREMNPTQEKETGLGGNLETAARKDARPKALLVAFDIEFPGTHGGSSHVQGTAKALARMGFEVSVLAQKEAGKPYRERHASIRIYRLPFPSPGFLRILLGLFYAKTLVPFLLWKEKPSLVWERARIFGGLSLVVAKIFFKTKTVYELNEPLVGAATYAGKVKEGSLACRLLVFFHRLAGNHADVITLTHPSMREMLPEQKCFLIPFGTDPGQFAPVFSPRRVRERLRLRDRFVVFYAGSFQRWHALRELVEAASLVKKKDPHVRFLLAGKGELYNEVSAWIEEKNLQGTVQLLGEINPLELPHYLNASDCCLALYDPHHPLIAKFDYFYSPLKVHEAKASAKPLIATDIGNLKELVKHKKNGLLVKDNSPEKIAEAIQWLSDHPSEARKMGELNRKEVLERYNWDRITESVVKRTGLPLPGKTDGKRNP